MKVVAKGKRLENEAGDRFAALIDSAKKYRRKPKRDRLHNMLFLVYELVVEFKKRKQLDELIEYGLEAKLLRTRSKSTKYHSLLRMADPAANRWSISRWAKAMKVAQGRGLMPSSFSALLNRVGVNEIAYPESKVSRRRTGSRSESAGTGAARATSKLAQKTGARKAAIRAARKKRMRDRRAT
jgi:hypothetical protein